MTTYPVSSTTDPKKLAGAISKVIQPDQPVILEAVGAAAINQAIKAIAVAQYMLGERESALCFIPAFQKMMMQEESRTMIQMTVYERKEAYAATTEEATPMMDR